MCEGDRVMIQERNAKSFCSEDISKIENYEEAIADKSQTWDCHHRGEILTCGVYSVSDLKKYDLYYNRPASELIFLTHSKHITLHKTGRANPMFGKHHTDEHRRKLSAAFKGRVFSEERRRKISIAKKGKRFSEAHKRKLSEKKIGTHHNNDAKQLISEGMKRVWEERRLGRMPMPKYDKNNPKTRE